VVAYHSDASLHVDLDMGVGIGPEASLR